MNRKIACTLLVTMAAFLLSGCSQGIDLTTENNDIVANYAARVILKTTYRDYTYAPDIRDVVYVPEGVSSEVETDEDGNIIETPKDYGELADYLNMENVLITYAGCVVTPEYPTDASALFVLNAEEGKKLVVVEYNVTNTGETDLVYSTPDDTPVFRLVVNDNTKVRSFKNIFLNDFSNMSDFVIQAGETRTAVIVFQVDESKADDIVYVEVQYGYDRHFISLPIEVR